MGSAKPIQRTKEIEYIIPVELHDVHDACFKIRSSLNRLEIRLATDFPKINGETAISHNTLQEAFYNYCENLSEAVSRQKIGKSEIFSVSEDPYAKLIPNFIKYLRGFGEVGISSGVYPLRDFERVGIFLKRKLDEFRLIGFLEIRQNPDQIEYFGYVPINVPEEEFHKCPVYHLSVPDSAIGNSAFVRLFSETINRKPVRIDCYENRGIEFP